MKKLSHKKGAKPTRRPPRDRQPDPLQDPLAIDPGQAQSLVLEMLAISGRSGNEAAVAQYVVKRLRKAGVPADAIRFDKAHQRGRNGEIGNLIVVLPGTVRAPRRMLMAHLDTVPLCEGTRPVVRDGWVLPADREKGLGADDRAGAAAVLLAASEVVRRGLPHPPLTFLWTVQEEIGLRGARHLSVPMLRRPKLAFNFDGGSSEKLTVGATGGYRMSIRVDGLASHAGNAPEAGVSAVAIAAVAIADLHAGGWHGRIEKDGRTGTSNVGVISGGQATNVVTPLVEIRAEARSHDAAFRGEIVAAIESAFRRAVDTVISAHGDKGRVSFDGRLDYEAFRLADDEPCVTVAEKAVAATGGHPFRALTNGGLDANWLMAYGVPTVTLGCGQTNPHTAGERLNLSEYHRATRVALRLASATEEG